MKNGTDMLADFADAHAPSEVVNSTVNDYAGGIYLAHSVAIRGQWTNLTLSPTTVISTYNVFSADPDGLLLYSWSMKNGTKFLAGFADTYAPRDVVNSTVND